MQYHVRPNATSTAQVHFFWLLFLFYLLGNILFCLFRSAKLEPSILALPGPAPESAEEESEGVLQGGQAKQGQGGRKDERLAAVGCLHTAVALELSAGQARAVELTRTRGGPTTPSLQPEEWIIRAYCASNLKSPSVAFGIRRPTRTPTGASLVERPPTAGWTGTPSCH